MAKGWSGKYLTRVGRWTWLVPAIAAISLILLVWLTWLWFGEDGAGRLTTRQHGALVLLTAFGVLLVLALGGCSLLGAQACLRAKETVERERRQLVSIFDSIAEPIYVTDPVTFELLYVNEAFKKQWGNGIGQPCFRVLQGLDGPCEFCSNDRILDDNVEKKYIWEFQNQKNGLWYRCIEKVIHWSDGRVVRHKMAIDITDRKKAEAALQQERDFAESLIETAQTIVLVLDPDARIVRFNPYMEQVSGYRLEEVQGRDWFSTFLPERDRERIRGVFRDAVGDIPTRGNVNSIVTKDGREREIEWYSKTLKDTDGRAVGVLAVGQDITERRLAAELAQQRQAEVEHLHRVNTMGEFASGLAHELNQPLCAISSNVQAASRMLRSKPGADEDISSALQQAVGQADRAAEIIRRLRNLVRKHEPMRTRVDLNAVIREATAFARAEARRHGIIVRLDLAEHVPPVLVDEVQIQQVLLNLTRNGIEAIDEADGGPRELAITSAVTDGCVEVAVRDSGRGLPPGDVEQLFRSFFTTKTYGLGLGLSLSRSLIEAHEGRLWATSNPDRGATFRFTLPVEEGVSDHELRTDCVCRR